MNKAIIILSLMLFGNQEQKQELSTASSNINNSICYSRIDTNNYCVTNNSTSKNNIDDFIAAFSNNAPDLWNTLTHCNAPDEEADSVNYLTPDMNAYDLINSDSLVWQTYECGHISEMNYGNDFAVYQNPVSTTLYFNDKLSEINGVKLLESQGKEIYIDTSNIEINSIDVSHLSSGIYFLLLETEKGPVLKKIIKKQV